MEHYVMLGGVRSWYAEQGAGDPPVLLGDDEVRLEHAVAMYRSLPKGELAIIPTVAPIRRRNGR